MFRFPVRCIFGPRLFAGLCLAAMMTATSSAAVILRIDISNLSAVTITATSAHAQNNDLNKTEGNNGVLLLGFFASEPGPTIPDTASFSNLYSPTAGFSYERLYLSNVSSEAYRDLNIYTFGSYDNNFSTTLPAFEGSATIDFSGFGAYLTPGSRGDILAGDAFYNTVVIGQWEIIPEPNAVALAFLPAALALLRHKRR